MRVRTFAATLLSVTLFAPAAFAASGDRQRPKGVNQRQENQKDRIQAGRHQDELTRREVERLRAEQVAIRAEERAYRRSGDGLNRREFLDLQRDLNKASRDIYRANHNNRAPDAGRP